MGTIKAKNSFEGGLDTDTTSEGLANNRLRDAVNMDTIEDGKRTKLVNIKGTTSVIKYLPDGYDESTLNILAVYEVYANYDNNCDGVFEEKNVSLIVFSYDKNSGSVITLIDLINTEKHQLYPNPNDSTDLGFPERGTVDASYTEERGTPQIFWDEDKNVLRSLNLNVSCSATIQPPTLRELEVRKRYAGGQPNLNRIEENGVLYAGTYQFGFRLYDTTNGNSSDVSLFCNPISIAKTNCSPIDYDKQLGGELGEIINKRIVLSIELTDEAQYYDAIQLYVLKNVDGLTIPPNTVYQTAPNKDWYNNPDEIVYSQLGIIENSIPVEDVTIEDSGIKSAKTQLIKDNRIWRGNITYYNRKPDNGNVSISNVQTIKRDADFKCGEESNRHKGYFRKEVYAFGIAYHDEYMNFGEVQPFDFSTFFKENTKRTEVATGSSIISATQYRISLNDLTGISIGDSVSYNATLAKVVRIGASYIDVNTNINIPAGATLNILYSQRGNQTLDWAWKFPDRSDNQFTIINELDKPQSLGLQILGIKNHPSWAIGFAIVRQKRIENVIYQSPHIPTVGVIGVPTQGVGPIEFDRDDNNVIKDDDADYKKEFDTIMPKVFGMGMAKNISKFQLNFEIGNISRREKFYCTFYPYYQNQKKEFSNTKEDLEKFGAEIPNYSLVYNPDYVFNKAGAPTYYETLQGNNKLVVVDAIAYRRKILHEEEDKLKISNTYQALKRENYFYNTEGYIKTIAGLKQYFVKLQDIDTDLEDNKIIKDYLLVLNGVEQFLLNKPFSSDLFYDIDFFGYLEKLSNQQGTSNAVPDTTSKDQFINTVANQRSILLNTEKKLLDFTYWIYEKYFTESINLFPFITSYTNKIYDTSYLNREIGEITDPGASSVNNDLQSLPIRNIFIDENEIAGGCYIVNNEKGLSDNRYSKINNEWIFTGTYRALSRDEITNNTPVDVDIWGGDCFVSKYIIKINNNTQRISDVYENIHAEANDYNGKGAILSALKFEKNVKTGSFAANVEFLELYLESKTNTNYHQQSNEYPAYTGDQMANYSNPYFYRYNGSYSVNNESKKFVSREAEIFTVNQQRFPARYVWSDQRLYQADGSGFVNIDGFSRFSVLNFKDLDEQYGEITKLIDFGGSQLHSIQQRKVRVDPIGRDIVETSDSRTLQLGTASVVGKGGDYLPFDNGSQHIRTVKQRNGICYFIDAKKQQFILFDGNGANPASDINMNAYFKNLLKSSNEIREIDLAGIIDATADNVEYIINKRATKSTPQDLIVFSLKNKGFKSRIGLGEDVLLGGVYVNQELYLLNKDMAYTAYTGDKRGLWFENYRNSSFKFVVNDYPGFVKIFSTMNFDMKGGLLINKDTGTAFVPSVNPAISDQNAELLIWNTISVTPKPFQMRNYQYWLNRIRNKLDRSKLRGHYMEVEFTIVNNEVDNREVAIMSILTDCETSYRNR